MLWSGLSDVTLDTFLLKNKINMILQVDISKQF